MKEKVAVAISGGVDSSVAALLLKEQGHEVTRITVILAMQPPKRAAQRKPAGCGKSKMPGGSAGCRISPTRSWITPVNWKTAS